jgi:hypothetical protein
MVNELRLKRMPHLRLEEARMPVSHSQRQMPMVVGIILATLLRLVFMLVNEHRHSTLEPMGPLETKHNDFMVMVFQVRICILNILDARLKNYP